MHLVELLSLWANQTLKSKIEASSYQLIGFILALGISSGF